MPSVTVNGVQLSYTAAGTGDPVLLIAPAASRARLWDSYQVPAFRRAGFRVITFDNRGSPPSSVPPGPYRVAELVADTAGLISALELGPCRVVGASLGAMVAQELTLARPDLVHSVALLASRGRTDFFRTAVAEVSAAAVRSNSAVPPRYAALSTMVQLFSSATLTDDRRAEDWHDLLVTFPIEGEGAAGQYEATVIPDRLAALTALERPALVMAFSEDVLMPPPLVRELADAIPNSRYVEIPGCGHFGFLEQPETVNQHLVDFFRSC